MRRAKAYAKKVSLSDAAALKKAASGIKNSESKLSKSERAQ